MQLQPICNKLEKLHETFQSHEEILSKLDASAADVEASLMHNKVVQAENRQLLSDNEDLKRTVGNSSRSNRTPADKPFPKTLNESPIIPLALLQVLLEVFHVLFQSAMVTGANPFCPMLPTEMQYLLFHFSLSALVKAEGVWL